MNEPENISNTYSPNIVVVKAVGWEGTFGFTMLALLLIPFNFIYVGPKFGSNPRLVYKNRRTNYG